MKEHRIVRLGIGRSFQTPTVFEALTVIENLDLAATFRRRTVGPPAPAHVGAPARSPRPSSASA